MFSSKEQETSPKIIDLILDNQNKLEEKLDLVTTKVNLMCTQNERALQQMRSEFKDELTLLKNHTETLEEKVSILKDLRDCIANLTEVVNKHSIILSHYEEHLESKENFVKTLKTKASEDIYNVFKYVLIFGVIGSVLFAYVHVANLTHTMDKMIEYLPKDTQSFQGFTK